MKKGKLIALVMLLVSYAPLELSRLIYAYGLDLELVCELVFIWVGFATGVWLLIRYMRVKEGGGPDN